MTIVIPHDELRRCIGGPRNCMCRREKSRCASRVDDSLFDAVPRVHAAGSAGRLVVAVHKLDGLRQRHLARTIVLEVEPPAHLIV